MSMEGFTPRLADRDPQLKTHYDSVGHLAILRWHGIDQGSTLRCIILRKEVIQPHLPIRLPCYDLVPLTASTFGASLLAVETTTSGENNSGGLTGGVYKAQEQIHRGVADPRLLAIPASSGRIAAHYPN